MDKIDAAMLDLGIFQTTLAAFEPLMVWYLVEKTFSAQILHIFCKYQRYPHVLYVSLRRKFLHVTTPVFK